jgi:hypothetical protein
VSQAGEAPAGTFAGRSFAWKEALVEVGVDPRSKVDADDVLEVRDIGGAGA